MVATPHVSVMIRTAHFCTMQTYEAKGIDEQSADSMCQHAKAEYVQMGGSNDEIVEEIAGGEGLDHGGAASVAPDAFLPVHISTLVINEHDP